jgi:hypothetical protein
MDEKAPIDERLEALAQSVEVMVSEGRRLQVLSDRNEHRWQSQDETNRLTRETIDLMRQDIASRELRQAANKQWQHTNARIEKLISAVGRLIRESEKEDGEA